jgi:hypothetical protein
MRRIGLVLFFWVVMSSVNAFADSLSYKMMDTTFYISPNSGFGDNVYFSMYGPGAYLQGSGGTDNYWFFGGTAFAPGSIGGGSTNFYFDQIFGGNLGSNGSNNIQLYSPATLFSGSFTFPLNAKNGSDFTVVFPASFSSIYGIITSTGQPFTLTVPPGHLSMTFIYESGSYYFTQASFSTVPEPGTLVLMGTGLFTVLGAARRRWTRVRTPAA